MRFLLAGRTYSAPLPTIRRVASGQLRRASRAGTRPVTSSSRTGVGRRGVRCRRRRRRPARRPRRSRGPRRPSACGPCPRHLGAYAHIRFNMAARDRIYQSIADCLGEGNDLQEHLRTLWDQLLGRREAAVRPRREGARPLARAHGRGLELQPGGRGLVPPPRMMLIAAGDRAGCEALAASFGQVPLSGEAVRKMKKHIFAAFPQAGDGAGPLLCAPVGDRLPRWRPPSRRWCRWRSGPARRASSARSRAS